MRDWKETVATIQVAGITLDGRFGVDIYCRSLEKMLSFKAYCDGPDIFHSNGFGPLHSIIVRPDLWGDMTNINKGSYGMETTDASFRQGLQKWQASDERKRLDSLLDMMPLPKIRRIVAFGLSHPTAYEDYRTIIQHAAILSIKEAVE